MTGGLRVNDVEAGMESADGFGFEDEVGVDGFSIFEHG
jgi:hypothetical protein